MNAEQSQRRQAAADRHDAALKQWPDRSGPQFTKIMNGVITDLTTLSDEIADSGSIDADRIKTLRWLGAAYFDLARSQDPALLQDSLDVYTEAEELLDEKDDVPERAKLNFNCANTLQALAAGKDRAMLEEAKQRYEAASEFFDGRLPDHHKAAQQVLAIVQTQLGVLSLMEQAAAGLDELKDIERTLKGESGQTPESEREALRRLKAFKNRVKAPRKMGREVGSLLDSLAAAMPGPETKEGSMAAKNLTEMRELLAATSAQADANDPDPMPRMFVRMLKERFKSDVASGKVDDVRRRALQPILDDLEALFDYPDFTMDDTRRALSVLASLMMRESPLAADASFGKSAPAGSRAEQVRAHLAPLKLFLLGEMLRPGQESGERRDGLDLFRRMAEDESSLLDLAADDKKTMAFERDVLRALALEAHTHARRHHVMIVEPIWPSPSIARDPNGVYFAGGSKYRSEIETQSGGRGLTLKMQASLRNPEQGLWDDLRAANVAVFDFTVAAGQELAEVCYALGVSRVLGTRAIIMASSPTQVPFDVEVTPVIVSGQRDAAVISNALDEAIYSARRMESDSSVVTTIEFAQKRFASPKLSAVAQQILRTLEDLEDEPTEARAALEQLFGFGALGKPLVVLPWWPGQYPASPACFHVTPYRPSWVKSVTTTVERACQAAGVRYVIGHQVSDPRVIRSIWEELCRATCVLVDLTGFSPNVALELGIAHALGKPTLIIGQDKTVEQLPPALRKMRVHPYSLDDLGSLKGLVQTFAI